MKVLTWLSVTAATLVLAFVAHPAARYTPSLEEEEPSLREVLRRTAAYVESYGEKASIVVATERYTQHVTGTRPGSQTEHRTTTADFAIVKTQATGEWVGFRDVIEVDGRSVTDRKDRLIGVLTSAAGAHDEARRLSAESARFNIGPIFRNFNVPTTALFFFTADNLERFKFSRKRVAVDGTWEVTFRETVHPTLIRTPEGKAVPTDGTVWVDAATGVVLRTRLQMTQFGTPDSPNQRGAASAAIDVTYSRAPSLEMWLPSVMTETYEVVRGSASERTTTLARYSDYRQFQTSGRVK